MNLDRDLADAQLGRGLFVEQAAHDQRQDLTLAWRQARKSLTQLGQLGSLAPGVAILRDCNRGNRYALTSRFTGRVKVLATGDHFLT